VESDSEACGGRGAAVLGEGYSQLPPHQLGGLGYSGEGCKLLQWGPGRRSEVPPKCISVYVFGQPFVKRFTLYMLSDRCLSVLSVCLSVCPVCDVGVLCPNGYMDQDETWHARSRVTNSADMLLPSPSPAVHPSAARS